MKNFKPWLLYASAALLAGVGQSAFAHASILNPINSGVRGAVSRIGVNHAVNHTTPPSPVVAQSVVFPTVNPILGRTDGVPVVSLGDYFATTATAAANGGDPWLTVAGKPQLIQSKDIFTQQIEQANADNQTVGWVSTKGYLQVNLHGEVPFRFDTPHFRSVLPNPNPNGLTAADLCVGALRIWVPVADIANPNNKPPFANSGAGGSGTAGITYNIWVDNTTPGLENTAFPPAVIENGAGTTVLTINRDTAVNPYPGNCAPAGGGDPVITVTVKPSADDVNALQYPGWGAPANGNTFR